MRKMVSFKIDDEVFILGTSDGRPASFVREEDMLAAFHLAGKGFEGEAVNEAYNAMSFLLEADPRSHSVVSLSQLADLNILPAMTAMIIVAPKDDIDNILLTLFKCGSAGSSWHSSGEAISLDVDSIRAADKAALEAETKTSKVTKSVRSSSAKQRAAKKTLTGATKRASKLMRDLFEGSHDELNEISSEGHQNPLEEEITETGISKSIVEALKNFKSANIYTSDRVRTLDPLKDLIAMPDFNRTEH